MTYKKLKDHESAQAKVRIDENGAITLVSYATDVVTIDPHGWLTCSGTYSATTRKHIVWFMREYTRLNYHIAKQCYEGNVTINIYTGEVVKL